MKKTIFSLVYEKNLKKTTGNKADFAEVLGALLREASIYTRGFRFLLFLNEKIKNA